MNAELVQRRLIHRMGNGPGLRPLCGAEGRVKLSTSGALVDCPQCAPKLSPDEVRRLQMAELEAGAARWRARHV